MSTLVLHYDVAQDGRVGLTVRLEDAEADPPPWPYPGLVSYEELEGLSSRTVAALHGVVLRLGAGRKAVAYRRARRGLPELVECGERLADRLLPRGLRAKLKILRDPVRRIYFQCSPLLNFVPFDLMFLDGEFVGYRYETGRWLIASPPPLDMPAGSGAYTVASVIDPGEQLPDYLEEEYLRVRRAVGEKFLFPADRQFVRANLTVGAFLAAVSDVDCANTLSHHHYESGDPGRGGFRIDAAGARVTAQQINTHWGRRNRPPLLLFSMACESGITRGWERDWPRSSRLYGVVDAALRNGVRDYVSTIVVMPVGRSAQAFAPFYETLAEGRSIGETLRRVRRGLRGKADDPLDGGTALGLALVLYGDPRHSYYCAAGHRTAGIQTAICGVDDEGTPCGRVVCTEDPGFASRRCELHWVRPFCSGGHPVERPGDLSECVVDGCLNLLCEKCTGAGAALCWFHACAEGHAVGSGARRTCTDPDSRHPEMPRTVCPRDDGFLMGLCPECLAEYSARAEAVKVCPHCNAYVLDENPPAGLCAGCGRELCSMPDCGSFHRKTGFCPAGDPEGGRGLREAAWLEWVERQGGADERVLSIDRLGFIERDARRRRERLLDNLETGLVRFAPLPRLRPAPAEFLLPRGRIRGVARDVADLGPEVRSLLREGWNLPDDISTEPPVPWAPPRPWIVAWEAVNRLAIHRVNGYWGRPVVVAHAVLTPVTFAPDRGPILAPVPAAALDGIEGILREWWRRERRGSQRDVHLLVTGMGGHAPGAEPRLGPDLLVALGDGTSRGVAALPALEGMPAEVRRFALLLAAQTPRERREGIREWTTHHLKSAESVTIGEVRRALSLGTEEVDPREVDAVFEMLALGGRHVKVGRGEDARLRPATRSERIRHAVDGAIRPRSRARRRSRE